MQLWLTVAAASCVLFRLPLPSCGLCCPAGALFCLQPPRVSSFASLCRRVGSVPRVPSFASSRLVCPLSPPAAVVWALSRGCPLLPPAASCVLFCLPLPSCGLFCLPRVPSFASSRLVCPLLSPSAVVWALLSCAAGYNPPMPSGTLHTTQKGRNLSSCFCCMRLRPSLIAAGVAPGSGCRFIQSCPPTA